MATLVITCESCGAKFKLDSDRLNKPRNKVRCAKCRSIFVIEQPEEEDLIHIEISEEENDFLSDSDSASDSDSDSDFLDDSREEQDDEQQDEGDFLPERPRAYARAARPLNKFLLAGIICISFILIAGLAFFVGGRYTVFQGKKAPAGPEKPIVTISDDLKAFYLENTNTGEVLVIEGQVLNKSTKPVSFVMIEGKLFNRKDSVVLTQRCYAGNPISRKDIAHLKLAQIQERMLNREGRDLKDVRIPPSGQAPFMLVFHDLPEINTLSNYSVNVVSSQLD